ncbi:MAG: hypothetical protein AAB730_01455 [Patescibacteria group bacterium]
MWTLFKQLLNWDTIQAGRKTAKLCLSALALETLLLICLNTFILAILQKQMSPIISALGLFWILLTASAIWFLGGVEVDSLFLARIFKLEAGKEFTKVLNIFFLIQSTIVLFFFFIPFWKFYGGFFLLPLLILGAIQSGFLANEGVNWKYFYRAYWGLIIFALSAMFVFSALNLNAGKPLLPQIDALTFPGSPFSGSTGSGAMAGLAGAALLLGIILIAFKKKVGSKFIWLGIIIIIALTVWQMKSPNASARPAVVQGTISTQLVSTGYELVQDERLVIIKENPGSPSPKKVWSKTTSGRWGYLNEWAQNPSWPSWYFKNDTAETIEIYLELPSGLALSDFRFEKEKI